MILILAVGLLAPLAANGVAASTSTAPPAKWGMNVPAVDPLTAAGAKPDYAMMWVGPWNDGKWDSVEKRWAELRDKGVTPVVQWYYWGDDISPECVENGCYSTLHYTNKSKDRWYAMVNEMQVRLANVMQGKPVIVIVETEFNKNGIVDAGYAPTFDAYMAEHHAILHKTAGVETIAGFGTWYSQAWDRFPKTVAASDYVAMQALRSSVRSTLDYYLGSVSYLSANADTMNSKFPGKPIFITDMGYSSYPEPEYAEHQNAVLTEFFERLPELEAKGVRAFMYRSLFDVNMNTANYHGEAERWWGLKHQDGSAKPSYETWLKGVGATPPPPPPGAPVPASLEAEAMKATAGGLQSDSSASGGKAWNLWSNGHLSQWVNATATGTYRFTVEARGSSASGVWPAMTASVAGSPAGSWSVASSKYATYAFDASLSKGKSVELQVAFTNDHRTSTEDRNLIVDVVRVEYLPPPNAAPSAAFTATVSGLTVSFDASASTDADGDALSFAWNFGDGSIGTGATVDHAYAADGTYSVTLKVTDAHGASDVLTGSVTVARANAAPAADFTASADGLAVAVDASATTDAEGDPVTYAWSFGDGATATGATASHAYAADGTYTVTLTATDDRGASGTASHEVTVARANSPPNPAFAWSADGLTASFDATATTDAEGDAIAFAWHFGDGTTGTGPTTTHAYAAQGTYTVTLTATDDRGASQATSTSVTVVRPNAAPIADFAWTATDLAASFDASASSDPDGDAVAFAWDFGDGTTGTGRTATHAYGAGGSYSVVLTVTDARGLTATTARTVNATEPAPSIEYSAPSAEAEAFAVKTTGGRLSDAGASGGAAWNVWSNGEIRDTIVVPTAGAHVVTVTAKGSPAKGTQAVMEVRLDGVTVGRFTVTDAWTTYAVRVKLAADTQHALSVAFVNDYYSRQTGEDRNLHVDVATVSVAPAREMREAEAFTTKSTGGRYSDAAASAGAGWNVWSNGHVAEAFTADATGTYSITVRAKGDAAKGTDPLMHVIVDGQLVHETYVSSAGYATYRVDVPLTAGTHEVRVAFVNDHYDKSTGQDRNLRVDVVGLRLA